MAYKEYIFSEAVPSTKLEAVYFLDNAAKHLENRLCPNCPGSSEVKEAISILVNVLCSI